MAFEISYERKNFKKEKEETNKQTNKRDKQTKNHSV